MSTREKAARALYGQSPMRARDGTPRRWEDLPLTLHERFYSSVDAVLNAIREPTQDQLLTLGLLSGAGPQPRATYVETWQSMIDSILNGEG